MKVLADWIDTCVYRRSSWFVFEGFVECWSQKGKGCKRELWSHRGNV